MADYPVPKSGVAYIFYVSLPSQANVLVFQSNPTLAAGDVTVSIDGAAAANITTLPTVTPAGGKRVKVSLSAAEMTGDNISVMFSDVAGAEWCDQQFDIQTSARGIADLAYPATSGRSMVVDAAGLVDATMVKAGPTGAGTAQTARDIGASVLLSPGTGTGQVDVTAGVVKSNLVQILATALTETVGGYLTAAFKKLFDVAAPVLTTASVNQTGDSYARLGAPAGASVSADIAANQTAITNLNNLSALANLFAPSQLVRPESGSIAYPFTFVVKDSEGHLIDVDTNTVTLTATNAAGVDRSANLSAVTHAGTGEYTFTYTVATAHADEGLSITARGTVQSATRKAYANCEVADASSLADLATLLTRVGTPAGASLAADVAGVQSDTTNIKTRLPAALSGGRMDSSVGAYAAGQDPATLILVTPANKLATDASGQVTAGTIAAGALTAIANAIWTAATRTLTAFGFTVALAGNDATVLSRLFTMTNATPAFTVPALANAPGGSSSSTLYGESGSISYTYTVFDVDNVTPLSGVAVYVSADIGGTQRSQTLITDALGRVRFELDPATVYFWSFRYDRSFTNPVAEVVS